MVLPIFAYGQPVLKKVGEPIDKQYPELDQLIKNMWETMYNAKGVGLAAPQIGLRIRLFVVDSTQMMEEGKEDEGIKMVFINALKIQEGGAPKSYEEGCLSIPDVHGDVERPTQIKISYYDTDWNQHEKVFTGINARVIQHEYDHIEGILFFEHLKPIRRRRIKRKLENIKKGEIELKYKMKFLR